MAGSESGSSEPRTEIIRARPTKEFFISTLVRDIELIPSIADLVDNSFDGAIRTRPDRNFAGLRVSIEIRPDHFKIGDNCGGIDPDIARNYAFCFGRPKGTPPLPHSVGQFGVGMKRALFKLGNWFRVDSSTSQWVYFVEEDVKAWSEDEENWNFSMKGLRPAPGDVTPGTNILVKELNPSVSQDFARIEFKKRLMEDLATRHHEALREGLVIEVDTIPVQSKVLDLFASPRLRPGVRVYDVTPLPKGKSVHVRLVTGLFDGGDQNAADAGWYVFCNGRMVLAADKSTTTAWGFGGTIPRYHPQYSLFRGYAFFDSEDSSLLPWRTTKTEVDEDSLVYRGARDEMAILARPVIDFINSIKEDTSQIHEEPDLGIVPVDSFAASQTFTAPDMAPRKKPKTEVTVSYHVLIREADAALEAIGARNYREMGKKTFRYYYEAEVRR
jgi:hypothetical protein